MMVNQNMGALKGAPFLSFLLLDNDIARYFLSAIVTFSRSPSFSLV